MASPKKDVTTAERRLIGSYLQQGGSLMFIADYNNTSFPELNQLLLDYNMRSATRACARATPRTASRTTRTSCVRSPRPAR
jgi:hypothetical protein